jgi:hypothetical protein
VLLLLLPLPSMLVLLWSVAGQMSCQINTILRA